MSLLRRGIISSGKLGGIAPPILDPDDIFGSNLKQWFDTSDAATLFTDAGITPVTSDEDRIYQMNDKSGNADHATQTTLSRRPYYKTTIINGLDSAEYRSAQNMTPPKPSFYSDSVSELSIFIVWKPDILTGPQTLYDNHEGSGGAANHGGLILRQEGAASTDFGTLSSANAWYITTPAISISTDVQVTGVVADGTLFTSYKDGVQVGSITLPANIDMNTNPAHIGIGYDANSDTNFFDGHISEMIICDVAPTAQQLADLQTYFSRWL